MDNDEKLMQIAIQQALKASNVGEVPVGALLVEDGKAIVKAHNMAISNNDPTAHAEIQVLRKAGEYFQNYRLPNTTLYVTLEPCAMCFGAIVHARVERIVFGAFDPKTGVCGSCIDLNQENLFNHKISITSGILEKECSLLLKKFFYNRRIR